KTLRSFSCPVLLHCCGILLRAWISAKRFTCFRRPLGSGDQNRRLSPRPLKIYILASWHFLAPTNQRIHQIEAFYPFARGFWEFGRPLSCGVLATWVRYGVVGVEKS